MPLFKQLNFLDLRFPTNEDCLKPYIDDPEFAYQDFAKRDTASNVPTFRAQVSVKLSVVAEPDAA